VTALSAKGHTGTLEVDDSYVTITRKGGMAKVTYGFTRGEKRIAIDSITSVQFKAAGMTAGYIQFTLAGANESTRGVVAAMKDENSVGFQKKHQKEFEAVRDFVEGRIASRGSGGAITQVSTDSVATQIRDLGKLRDDGLLTEEEFAEQKAKLLRGE
jgi:hypothetical protein